MTQRPQHGQYGHEHDATAPAGTAPWPGMASRPAPAQHVANSASAAQFQYAPNFVQPGTPAGQAPPMTASGNTIGAPVGPQGAVAGHGYGYGYAGSAVAPQLPPGAASAAMHGGTQHPQAWAYPTPSGLQIVQPGDASAHHVELPRGGTLAVRSRRRVRWETIIPAAAVICLVASIGIFIADFDRMTGRDQAAGREAATDTTVAGAASGSDPAAGANGEPSAATGSADPADDAAVIAQARTLSQRGRYADARNLLEPLVARPAPSDAAVALQQQVAKADARNTALLKRLAGERRAKRWSKVIATLAQVERMHPLSASQLSLRSTARAELRRAKAARAAKARAAAIAAARPTATTTGGGAPAPAAGGTPPASAPPAARPPSNVSSGSIPTRPDLPNPTGGSAGGAAAVGGGPAPGGGGDNCHVHDGEVMCHD